MAMTLTLPYPQSDTVKVFRDDGEWPERWWQRASNEIRELFVALYDLRVDDRGDVDLTVDEWRAAAEKLLADHPGCVFVYI